nr:MAG TPA: hypothetical protein [Caudoviricetes sp.]
MVKVSESNEGEVNEVAENLISAELKPKYSTIEITFKSGDTISYCPGEWDDYAYDGGAILVKNDGITIGIYNFDNVFCVELKVR